jgi:hypothetical protein
MAKKYSLFTFLTAVGEVAFVVIYFPFWWYSFGFARFLSSLGRFLKRKQEELALLIWLKNIFRPMYGQSDILGRLISFFVRVIQIIFRTIGWLFFLILTFLLAIFWLALPPLLLTLIILQLL